MGLHLAPPTQNATAKYYHLPYSPLAVICLNCSSFFFIYLFIFKEEAHQSQATHANTKIKLSVKYV